MRVDLSIFAALRSLIDLVLSMWQLMVMELIDQSFGDGMIPEVWFKLLLVE